MAFNPDQYILRQVLAPSGNGLLDLAVAITIRNITSGLTAREMRFVELGGQTLFVGTNGASGSVWGFQRITATPANGTVVTPFRCHPGGTDPASQVEVRFSNTGTITSATPNGQPIYHLGIASQVGSAAPQPLLTNDENTACVLAPGQCLIVYAHGAIVAGSRATVGLRWFSVA